MKDLDSRFLVNDTRSERAYAFGAETLYDSLRCRMTNTL
jgi:hypothetical protein